MALGAGKAGGAKALASKPNLLSSLRVQTSSYGQVVPIVYGYNRIAGRLIWAGDFTAIPHTSTTKVGGKGLGSGGGNSVSNTTYTYQTAVAILICAGPVIGIGAIWDTKGRMQMLTVPVPFTVPGGGGTFTPGGGQTFQRSNGVSRVDSYSVGTNDYGSDGAGTLTGNQNNPMTLVGSAPGAGQYTLNTSTGAHTFSAADAGKTVTINYTYYFPDSNSNGLPLQKLSLTLFLGATPQTAWSYLTSAHPGQDLGYNGIAYVANATMDLGESGTLPNLSFETLGLLPFPGIGMDAEPSAIIGDSTYGLLTNAVFGLNNVVPLGSLTQYRNYCTANSLLLSPVYETAQSAAKCVQDLLDVTNSAAVWSEGVLKLIPYGDSSAVGNGVTFTPNTTPIYDLTTADLLSQVTVKRPSVSEVFNSVSVEFVNRANDYNVDVAEDKDDAAIALYGLRKASPLAAHAITTTAVAKFAANTIRKRSIEIRATYTFSLGWQFNLLEPMDLVTLTIPEVGYNKKPVRITAIREDEGGTLQIDAEDFPWGTATATLYPHQTVDGFAPQANADPGAVSAPIIFEANDRLSLTGNYEVWLGACPATVAITGATNATPIKITAAGHGFKTGQKTAIAGVAGNTAANGVWLVTLVDKDNFTLNGSVGSGAYTSGGFAINEEWGGCTVWVSPDNTTYAVAGKMYGPSRMGTLTSTLASHADPDTSDTLAVDLTKSLGSLNTGTAGDCDNFRTLCYVDGELISYQTATLTALYKYNLTTRLRRGVFGSPIGAHSSSTSFLRLDDAVFVWEADPTLVGTTIYFKFTSFNRFGLMEQSLANATAYSFAFSGNFGNISNIPTNNAKIDSTFVSGTAANIRVYGPGGAGNSYTATKTDQTTRTIAAATISTVSDVGGAPQINTLYFVSYDFNTATHNAWKNADSYVQAKGRGQMSIGSLITCNNSGGSGSPGGGDPGGTGEPQALLL